MSKLVWDRDQDKRYEHGVDHGVLYTEYMDGDPDQQTLDNLLHETWPGMEFYYPAYTSYSDRGPDEHDQALVETNLYPSNFYYNKLDWSTYTYGHYGWTDRKDISEGQVVDGSKAVSDLISITAGTYALWFWCANSWCFEPSMNVYFYTVSGSTETFVGAGSVNPYNGDPDKKFVKVPAGANGIRLTMPMPSISGDTINSLYIDAESTKGNTPEANIEAWKQACETEVGEEALDPTDIPESWYKLGGKLYTGSSWNGLTSVTESPEGAEKTDIYADNIKYASLRSAETFGGTVEAYTYPPALMACNGEVEVVKGATIHQQPRKHFGLAYRTLKGPDEEYKIHLVYNCTCSPSERAYETVNDSPDAITFSWEFDSTPMRIENHKHSSYVTITPAKYWALHPEIPTEDGVIKDPIHVLEALLFGHDGTRPFMPSLDFVASILGGVKSANTGTRPIGIRPAQLAGNALLDISVDQADLTPSFNPDVLEYAVYYDSSKYSVTRTGVMTVKAYREDAEVGGSGSYDDQRTIYGNVYKGNGQYMAVTSPHRSGTATPAMGPEPAATASASGTVGLEFSMRGVLSENDTGIFYIPVKYNGETRTYTIRFIPEANRAHFLKGIKFFGSELSDFNPVRVSYPSQTGSSYDPAGGGLNGYYFPFETTYEPEATSTGTIYSLRSLAEDWVLVHVKDLTDNTQLDLRGSRKTDEYSGFAITNGHSYRILFKVLPTVAYYVVLNPASGS